MSANFCLVSVTLFIEWRRQTQPNWSDTGNKGVWVVSPWSSLVCRFWSFNLKNLILKNRSPNRIVFFFFPNKRPVLPKRIGTFWLPRTGHKGLLNFGPQSLRTYYSETLCLLPIPKVYTVNDSFLSVLTSRFYTWLTSYLSLPLCFVLTVVVVKPIYPFPCVVITELTHSYINTSWFLGL